jgi:transcriptional regulator with XRE-family HTH domain
MIKKENLLLKFGQQVRDIRKFKHLSQENLAHKANLHRTYIGMIERGEKNITLLNFFKISEALETNPSILIGFYKING